MSFSSEEFILIWLNNTLNLQPQTTNISKEFSNGYKFALLLSNLNEITKEELDEFKDSNIIDEIINKDVSKATVILYKIKNSVKKKEINFLEIKTSDIKPTQEELNLKINELMQSTTKENIEEQKVEKENENIEQIVPRKEIYDKYTLRKMFDENNELNPIESVSSGLNKNQKLKRLSKSINNYDNLNEKNLINNDSNNQTIGSNKDNNQNFRYNNVKTVENNINKRNKKILPKIKIRKNLKYDLQFISNTEEKEKDFFNDFGMMKINEMKMKLRLEELKKTEK